MRFLARAWPPAVAAVVGLAFGGGLLWWAADGSDDEDPPIRSLRLPCNVADAGRLEAVLPGAVVVSTARYGEASESRWLIASCGLAPSRTSASVLELELRRFGQRRQDVIPGNGKKIVVRSGAELAREAFDDAMAGDAGNCRPQAVGGVAEQAAGCHGARHREPAYRLIARRGDLLLTVTRRTRPTDDQEPLHRLAAALLQAAR